MSVHSSSSNQGAKKILVNPLIAGNSIHYNKGKYTLASSTFGVKETRANVPRDKVHYNPKFLNQRSYTAPKKENVHINPNYILTNVGYDVTGLSSGNSIHVNPNFLSGPSVTIPETTHPKCTITPVVSSNASNKYKFVRKHITTVPALNSTSHQEPTQPKLCEPKTISKYKLVYSTAPSVVPTTPTKSPGIMIKSKYSIRTCQTNIAPVLSISTSSRAVMNRNVKKRISYDFKRISRTKLVRKSVLISRKSKKKWLNKSFKITNRRLSCPKIQKQLFKLNNKINPKARVNSENSLFQAYSSTKIVRKSVLRAQIDARKLLRKSLNSSVTNVFEVQPLVRSKYKYIRPGISASTKNEVSASVSKKAQNLVKAKKRKTVIAKLTSKLRKNNQRCMFFNRFGRCKGKDKGTCNKIHDPLYISICKKLPFGECNDKTCLLSHDIRPGKMPTCYHYLAGICKREQCPFLHIKVNPKAPICHSFLQGFCPDVLNCLKRHEYVCPVFAEKGSCPKGKSCAHPHKIPTVHSKLLADDQRPLMTKTSDSNSNTRPRPLFVIDECPPPCDKSVNQPQTESSTSQVEPKPKEPPGFTRYFAVPLSSELCDIKEEPDDDSGT